MIREGEQAGKAESFGSGDVIGVLMDIASPMKNASSEEVREGSRVVFFKNGRTMLDCGGLKQLFYCFAVSLFNYSQIEVLP